MTAARWKKIGLIAGGGPLPRRVAQACAARGEPFQVLRLEGIADSGLEAFPGESVGLGEAGKIIRLLKSSGCDAVVMSGVVGRPDFRKLKPDWRGAALIPKLVAAAARGDGAILKALVETFESEGFIVAGVEEVTRELLSPKGAMGLHRPDEDALKDIVKGAAIIRALGPFDIGQGTVVAGGHVIAIEAAEGTDAMLARCGDLGEGGGVLIKRPKPGQEMRVDLPTVGPETIRRAQRAGLGGVAVEAGRSLVVDREETTRLADELGLFLYGFEAAEVDRP
jgi:hypothetical protein